MLLQEPIVPSAYLPIASFAQLPNMLWLWLSPYVCSYRELVRFDICLSRATALELGHQGSHESPLTLERFALLVCPCLACMSGRRIMELADARSVVYILLVSPGLQADNARWVERGGSA